MNECPSCGARLETPLGCHACGLLLFPEDEQCPFDMVGLKPAWEVDPEDLRHRLVRYSRITHPDYYASASQELQALAEEGSAALNAAYDLLSDDFRRADHLLCGLDGPSESQERAMPSEFLVEVLEWNELLEAARTAAPGDPARARLVDLEEDLQARRSATMEAVGAALSPLPAYGDASLVEIRRRLNAVRYLDRTLQQIRDLRGEQASSG